MSCKEIQWKIYIKNWCRELLNWFLWLLTGSEMLLSLLIKVTIPMVSVSSDSSAKPVLGTPASLASSADVPFLPELSDV